MIVDIEKLRSEFGGEQLVEQKLERAWARLRTFAGLRSGSTHCQGENYVLMPGMQILVKIESNKPTLSFYRWPHSPYAKEEALVASAKQGCAHPGSFEEYVFVCAASEFLGQWVKRAREEEARDKERARREQQERRMALEAKYEIERARQDQERLAVIDTLTKILSKMTGE